MKSADASQHGHSVRPDKGFTLVELLTVIAIIGLLAAIALPTIGKIREKARIGAVKEQLAQIETAVEAYYVEWDTFPPMGNDWLGGCFYPSEDIGSDGIGPFSSVGSGSPSYCNSSHWQRGTYGSNNYEGPDTDGTEGNYRLDPGEDVGLDLIPNTNDYGEGNGRLDGTYYDRLGMFASEDKQGMFDLFGENQLYHYYAADVIGTTDYGMPRYRDYAAGAAGLTEYMNVRRHPSYYNRWVLYSVGPDGEDHGLHNYFLVMQSGEDVGVDGFSSDVTDDDNNFILFEPSTGENNDTSDAFSTGLIIRETGWSTPGGITEAQAPGGNPGMLEGPTGEPIFSFDVRKERRRQGQVYAMPDGGSVGFGMIMRYGP